MGGWGDGGGKGGIYIACDNAVKRASVAGVINPLDVVPSEATKGKIRFGALIERIVAANIGNAFAR
ncbi:hypothetical protein HSBAA_34470 [Vreelandella sulfidaeris]|uniref:Uncharacterized protein n=1 Tax=Vreelandella sulfidaeris TaxID=115553 RepID=A0A455UC37_9GAMM|nr:hypothetical protein HSBAA_34470 [Halomonas sulfidaeris]